MGLAMHTLTYDMHLNCGIKAVLVVDLHEKNPAEA